jgi:hypothetical protein
MVIVLVLFCNQNWTATDAYGNTSTASQTINVTDTTAPNCRFTASTMMTCRATSFCWQQRLPMLVDIFTASADVTTVVIVLVRILLLELGPLLIHVVIHLQLQTINVTR